MSKTFIISLFAMLWGTQWAHGATPLEEAQGALTRCSLTAPAVETSRIPYLSYKQIKLLMENDPQVAASPWGHQWTALAKVVGEVATPQGPLYITQKRHPEVGWYLGKWFEPQWKLARLHCLTTVAYNGGLNRMLTDGGSPQWNIDFLGPHLAPYLGFTSLDEDTVVVPSPTYIAQRLVALNTLLEREGHPPVPYGFYPVKKGDQMGQKTYWQQFIEHKTIPLENQGLLRHHDTHYHVAPIVLMPPVFAQEMARLVEGRQQLLAHIEEKEDGRGPVWNHILSRSTRDVDYLGFLTLNVVYFLLDQNLQLRENAHEKILKNTLAVFSSFTDLDTLSWGHGGEPWIKAFAAKNPALRSRYSPNSSQQQRQLFTAFQQRWQLLNDITKDLAPQPPLWPPSSTPLK